MFLADRTNLQAIHDSPVLMLDGTFTYCPKEFYREEYQTANKEVKTMHGQVYTMHAVYSSLPTHQSSFVSGNLLAKFFNYIQFLGIGFLPHKNEQTYLVLFQQLRLALTQEFGDFGSNKTVMMDFEVPAHNAIKKVFPEWQLRTCYFHFIKNVIDQAKKKKLKPLFGNDAFKRWISELLGKL